MKKLFSMLSIFICLIVVGCVEDKGLLDKPLNPDELEITRQNPLEQSIPKLDEPTVIKDKVEVEKVYSSLTAIHQPFPSGSISCPNDTGVKYHLSFLEAKKKVLEADVEGSGCREIRISNSKALWTLNKEGGTFFELLAQTLGLTETQLGGFGK